MAGLGTGKVYNRNKYALNDEFKGTPINLQPGEYVEMDYWDYEEFKGEIPTSIKSRSDMYDGSGNQRPQSFKILEYVGPIPGEEASSSSEDFNCHACGGSFPSAKALDEHVDKWHLDQIEDEDVREERSKRRRASK